MERAHQNHEKVSADNYLEAGKSANMIALISALFATFISYLEGGAIQPISVLLLSTSVITIIVHKMRQLYLFMNEFIGEETYSMKEKFVYNIPVFLFLFYLQVMLLLFCVGIAFMF